MAFQSPVAGYDGQRISFGDLVNLSPHFTAGNYPNAGMVEGSLLAVDRKLRPPHGAHDRQGGGDGKGL